MRTEFVLTAEGSPVRIQPHARPAESPTIQSPFDAKEGAGTTVLRFFLFLSLAPTLVLGPLALAMFVFTGAAAEWMAVSAMLGIILSVAIPANLPKDLLGYGLALGSAILCVFLIVAWKALLWILIMFMWAANA